jgi:hypothetical protein
LAEVVRYIANNGIAVPFEVDLPVDFQPAGGAGGVAGNVREAVRPALDAAAIVLDQIKALRPGEIEVRFGIKVTGTANWVVAKAGTEGSFEITLTWKPGETSAGQAEEGEQQGQDQQ